MASDECKRFAVELVREVTQAHKTLQPDSVRGERLLANDNSNHSAILNLEPFYTQPSSHTAAKFFTNISTIHELLGAYRAARRSMRFENDLPDAMTNVSDYANTFLTQILRDATATCSDQHAKLIAMWVKNLDVYCAVKAVESLLNSRADIALLEVARERNWTVHFDHLAIRCGTKAHLDAERITQLLLNEHGYVASQIPEEGYYQFPDGWNAYPVYKLLSNGQVLRLFIDQSDADHPTQIIQHWNRVYGYTAHHLAMRATRLDHGQRIAVTLDEIMEALKQRGVGIMTPTGEYTAGLLLQVFTQPERDGQIPIDLKNKLEAIYPQLGKIIANAKLLELVSRREMEPAAAKRLYALYGMHYDANNPLHSAPVYTYFLPAQAAHVIKTSQQVA